MHKVDEKQPGGDTSGDRPVLHSQISSESISIGAVSQQVQNVHDMCHLFVCLFVCVFLFNFFFYKTSQKIRLTNFWTQN